MKFLDKIKTIFKKRTTKMKVISATDVQYMPTPALIINYLGNKRTGDWSYTPLAIYNKENMEITVPNYSKLVENFMDRYPANSEGTFTHNYFFVYEKEEIKELIKQLQKLIGE